MAQETVNRMIGRALTDRRFREELLRSPRRVARGLPFTPEERKLVASVRGAASLEEFSRKLNQKLPEFSRDGRRLDVRQPQDAHRRRMAEEAAPAGPNFTDGAQVSRRRPASGQGTKITLALDPFSTRFLLRTLAALLVLGTLSAVVARANQAVPSGEGMGAASGYAVSGVEYSLSAADPSHIDSVTLGLTSVRGSQIPAQVSVSVDGGVSWTRCSYLAGSRWTCPARTSVQGVSSLRVVATQ